MNFSQQNLDSYYDKLINQIQSAIRLKEHEFECYRNTYRRLYKSNYLLKKRYEELEFKYSQVQKDLNDIAYSQKKIEELITHVEVNNEKYKESNI